MPVACHVALSCVILCQRLELRWEKNVSVAISKPSKNGDARYSGTLFYRMTNMVKLETRPTVSQYLNELPG